MRERYNAFIARHEIAWELTMDGLAVAFVALGFLVDEAAPRAQPAIEAVEWALTLVFIVEFASRLAAAHDRRRHLTGPWIDVVAGPLVAHSALPAGSRGVPVVAHAPNTMSR